jgi:hypothetical protein
LGPLVKRHEELLDKVAELKATDQDKVEYQAVKRFLLEMAARLIEYNHKLKEIKGNQPAPSRR